MSGRGDADVVVVGLGVGGEAVAGALAGAGVDVVGIENELVGGECPYWGCIPTKMMIRAANLIAETRRVPGLAGVSSVTPDWTPVARRIRDEATDTWNDQVAVDRFTGRGGRFVRGRATILGPREVEVAGVGVIVARRGLVVATGGAPVIPAIPGLPGTPFWTNRDAVRAERLPTSMVVLGAGAIGTEIGQAYSRFGVRVTIVDAASRPLPREEPEAGDLLAAVLNSEGITLRLGRRVTAVSHSAAGFAVTLDDARVERAEALLVATGRRPSIDADTWRRLGLAGEPGALPVDARLRVADGVWAVGDVTGHGAFTHVATYQADSVVRDILGRGGPDADYRALPRVTFTDPEVGSVGLTEREARDEGHRVVTGSAPVSAGSRGWIHKAGNSGLIKLVADPERDVLLGAMSAGPQGGEVLGALSVAVHARVPVGVLESMIWAYPTFHRGIQDAIRDLRAHT